MCNRTLHLLLLPWLFIFFFLSLLQSSTADVGTAASYGPPYFPTVCYGNDSSQFPANNLFAAAGEGIWDNGASCGRQYLVRCLSSATPGACVEGQTIRVKVVDQAAKMESSPSMKGTTIVLSMPAFQEIADQSVSVINIEFTQV